MIDLFLVRHAETAWFADNRYAGRTDVPLTERGHRQAEELAAWARFAGLDAIWCSTLSRTRLTADPAARATALPLREDERLCELAFGDGEGLTMAEMEERFPAAVAAFRRDPVSGHLPRGEDPHHAVARALACLGDVERAHPGGRVLVVTHSTLMRLVLCHLLGIPLSSYRRTFPVIRNCALTELAFEDGQAKLHQFNGVALAAQPAGAAPAGEAA